MHTYVGEEYAYIHASALNMAGGSVFVGENETLVTYTYIYTCAYIYQRLFNVHVHVWGGYD